MAGFYYRDRDRIRTCDRLLRRQMLYPAELRDQSKKKDSKIESFLSGWQDSNLRPPAPKAGAITGLRYTPKRAAKLNNFNSQPNSIIKCGEEGIRTPGTRKGTTP